MKERRLTDKIILAWMHAKSDLGIRVTAPFTLTTEIGESLSYEALVHDFGGPLGTVIGTLHDSLRDERTKTGYYVSNLGDNYASYDRNLFMATLDDWQWFGDKEPTPAWYTGKRWS